MVHFSLWYLKFLGFVCHVLWAPQELSQCHLCTGMSCHLPWTVFLTLVFQCSGAAMCIMRLEDAPGLGLILNLPHTTGPLTFTPRTTHNSQPVCVHRTWPAGNCSSSSMFCQRSQLMYSPHDLALLGFIPIGVHLLGTNYQGPGNKQGQSTATHLTQAWLLSELQPLLTSVPHCSINLFFQDGLL